MKGRDSPIVLLAGQTSLETSHLLQRDVGKLQHCQRRMTDGYRKGTYRLTKRIECVYLSQEETSQKNSRKEVRGSVVPPCATHEFALCGL